MARKEIGLRLLDKKKNDIEVPFDLFRMAAELRHIPASLLTWLPRACGVLWEGVGITLNMPVLIQKHK